jgi:flavodoxin
MKATVAYYSKTGHSRKIARGIGDALGLPIVDIAKNQVLEPVDSLFIVSGIYAGKAAPEMMNFVNQLDERTVGKVYLITSSLIGKTFQNDVRDVLTEKGITVDPEEFTCRGGFLFFGMSHPNKNEIQGSVEYTAKMMAAQAASGQNVQSAA